MQYNVQLIREANYKPTFWSGGMATELMTYPPTSTYANRDFLWRLGFAKIDILESTFSSLPNISRKLMVTEGKLTLDHKNKYKKILTPFDQDNFMGDWETKTYGKACVFNLMTRENYSGELIPLNLLPKKQLKFKYEASANKDLVAICLYSVNDNFKLNINNKNFSVSKNDLILINCLNSNCVHEFMFFSTSLEVTNIIASIIYR